MTPLDNVVGSKRLKSGKVKFSRVEGVDNFQKNVQ